MTDNIDKNWRELSLDENGNMHETFPAEASGGKQDFSDHTEMTHGTNWENSNWTERMGAIVRAISGRPGFGPEIKK